MEPKKWRILIAEDDDLNRMLLGEILKKFGYPHRSAANGQEAVELFEQDQYDAVFLALQMPVLDGKEAARQMRDTAARRGMTVRIVAISGDKIDLRTDSNLFDQVLQKPYLPQYVKELLEGLEKLEGLEPNQDDGRIQDAFQEVLEKVGGDREFLHSLLERFHTSSQEHLVDLQEALKRGDLKLAREVAHKWKGACSIFNASEAMDLLAQVEDQIATGSDKKVQELIVLVVTQTNIIYSEYSDFLSSKG